MPFETILAEQRRYDGRLVRRWSAILVTGESDPTRLVVPFGTTFETADGLWRPPTAGIYHYWSDRWHDVITVISPDGGVLGLYCNILRPPRWEGRALRGIDLDLDVWVNPDRTYRILDSDEFEENVIALHYPADIVSRAREALDLLIDQLIGRSGVFATDVLFEIDPALTPILGEPVVSE